MRIANVLRMHRLPLSRRHARWLHALATVALCTCISEVLAPGSDLADIIMVYLAGVAYVALRTDTHVSVATVAASIFLFDLLYVPPRWGLNPLNPSHLLTLAVMLLVGLVISSLAAQVRSHAELAERRARRAQALTDLAGRLASARNPAEVAEALDATTRAVLATPSRLDGEGRLLLDHTPATTEDRELAEAFETQAGLALQRCMYERRSAEAQLAAESELLRSTLLSGVSHDLRTPLTTIVGSATSLLDQGQRLDEERRRRLVAGILGEAKRLHQRVSHLLDLTCIEAGEMKLHAEWCPVDDLVAEAVAAMGEQLRDHPVHVDAPGDLVVWCDARLLEQVVVNLLDNAVRHTPAGTAVRIAVAAGESDWTLRVTDDGPGLPQGPGDDIFARFKRGHGKPRGSGFGLGLAICAAIANLHGGTIAAGPGPGAAFTLRLPQPVRQSPEEELQP